jgi:hypothetical protein
MSTDVPAALGAKRLLSSAARALRTADPVERLAPFIDESLRLPPGSHAYQRPHAFDTRFSERSPRNLALGMSVGDPLAPPSERAIGATKAMRFLLDDSFGADARRWFDGRAEALRWGSSDAWVTSAFDNGGVREAQVTYAWGPQTSEALTRPIHEAVQMAVSAMPSLRPALTTISCGRSFGSQEITFRVDGALRLDDLRPLMDRFGLGGQHTRLVNALAFVLGARFTLPPDTTLVTLRPTTAGMELRLDVDLEAIADIPPNVASLLQLQMVERPQSVAALEEWVGAMTPIGFLSPGSLSVLSVMVRPNLGPRLAIDMRPSVVTGEPVPTVGPPPATGSPGAPVSPEPLPGPPPSSEPMPMAMPVPVAAGLRSPWEPRS